MKKTKLKRIYGYTVLSGMYVAIAVGLSVGTGCWWAGLAFTAMIALITTAIVCVFS